MSKFANMELNNNRNNNNNMICVYSNISIKIHKAINSYILGY